MLKKASEKFLNWIKYGPHTFIAIIVIPIIIIPIKRRNAATIPSA